VDHGVVVDKGQVLALFLGPIVFRHRCSCTLPLLPVLPVLQGGEGIAQVFCVNHLLLHQPRFAASVVVIQSAGVKSSGISGSLGFLGG
jgi:hypothetical protein